MGWMVSPGPRGRERGGDTKLYFPFSSPLVNMKMVITIMMTHLLPIHPISGPPNVIEVLIPAPSSHDINGIIMDHSHMLPSLVRKGATAGHSIRR